MTYCKHDAWEIITSYFKDKPAKVESVKCASCGLENEDIKEIQQMRENRVFEIYDEKSPVVW